MKSFDITIDSTLNYRIHAIEEKLDSLKKINSLRQLEFELNQKQEIISQVNEFYDSAWLKLIIVISILGVIIPVLFQFFQRQNLKDLVEFIRNQVNDNFDLRIKELEKFNQSELQRISLELRDKLNYIESKNSALLSEIDGSTFYLQGKTSMINQEYSSAVSSFLRSALYYINSDRYERVNPLLVNARVALMKITQNDIASIDSILAASPDKLNLEKVIDIIRSDKNIDLFKENLDYVAKQIDRIKNLPKADRPKSR